MYGMFSYSNFDKDLSDWKPYKVDTFENTFMESHCTIPYWANYENIEIRRKAIDSYVLNKELNKQLHQNNKIIQKIKI